MSYESQRQFVGKRESVPTFELVPYTPEDYAETLRVQFEAALKGYPNSELGITEDDIRADYAEALRPEAIKAEVAKQETYKKDENHHYTVAKHEGSVVGFCITNKYEDRNQLMGIYIKPDFQSAGLGKKLWEDAKSFIDPTKDTYVMVLPYNHQAIAYYKSLGFEMTGKYANEEEGSVMKSGAIMPSPVEMKRPASRSTDVKFVHLKPREASPELPAQHDIDLEIDGGLAGYAKLVYFSKPVPGYELGMLYINEDKRGKGYGSALMDKIESMLKEKGKAGILREGIAELDPNSPAIGMYERRGWIPVPGTEDEFVFNLPKGVEPSAFLNFSQRHHTPTRMERLDRRYTDEETMRVQATDEEERQ
jgi:ribosomal protein S18 acetylase RimI-like enzyme